MDTFERIKADLAPSGATLIAVSKTKPISAIEALYARGQRAFGENRVAEMVEKHAALPKDIEWHAIGHLQRNKVKDLAPFVHLIHSVDSLRLLKEIDKQAAANDRVIDCLLQFHIAREESKYGFDFDGALGLLSSPEYAAMRNVRIVGVMGMATFTDDQEQVAAEFQTLHHHYKNIKLQYFAEAPWFKEVSMGMSGDYTLALAHGSTMVRIGSLLFGAR